MSFNPPHLEIPQQKPLIVVISGLSGAGKDSIIQGIKERETNIHFVVTATDRPPRANEVEGVDYFFVSTERFEQMIARNELIEHAVVYGQFKGIPRAQIDQAMESGKDVLMRIDIQGARKVKSIFPQAVLIFILPESNETWVERFTGRHTESEEELNKRFQTAQNEINEMSLFDYLVINKQGQLEEAVDTVLAILTAEHSRNQNHKVNL